MNRDLRLNVKPTAIEFMKNTKRNNMLRKLVRKWKLESNAAVDRAFKDRVIIEGVRTPEEAINLSKSWTLLACALELERLL